MCPGQACGGAAWGGELPLARVVRDCAPESGVVFIYMTRLARTHNKTRALQCHPPPLRGKSSTVHRPRRPRVSQHLPAVNPHPVAIHSRPFEQPFRTGSAIRYQPDLPQISRTDTRVSSADRPSAWDKTGGAGGGKCRRKPTATAPNLPRNRSTINSMFQPLWQTNRGICSWTALEARCPTTINLVIGAIFSTCAGTLGGIQKVHSDLRQIDHLSSTPQAQSTAPSAVLTRPDTHTDRWAKRGNMGFFTIACRGSIVPEGLVESLFSQRSRTLFFAPGYIVSLGWTPRFRWH